MAFSTVPAPLYTLYQQRDGFSQLMITIIFAAYALGVMLSLFLAGHLSDLFGRRRMLLIAMGINVGVAVLFIFSSSVVELLAARAICGVAVGIATGTATAYLAELHGVGRPGEGRERSDVLSSATPMLGLGAGALVAGVLAQYVAWPLQTSYVVFVGLFIVAIIGVQATPETVVRRGVAYQMRRIKLPQESRARFLAASGTALASFAVTALFSSVAPGFIAQTLDISSKAVAGMVTCIVFSAGAVAPVFLMRATLYRLLKTGFICMIAGLAVLVAGVWFAHFALFLIGGIIAGAACGILFKGCVSTVVSLAQPAVRGEALAGLFLMAYIGLSVPIVTLGIAAQYTTTDRALMLFAVVFICIVAAVHRRLLAPARAEAYARKESKGGKHFSMAKPNPNRRTSSHAGPSSSRPTGRPAVVMPAGSVKPGMPATDAGLVLRI